MKIESARSPLIRLSAAATALICKAFFGGPKCKPKWTEMIAASNTRSAIHVVILQSGVSFNPSHELTMVESPCGRTVPSRFACGGPACHCDSFHFRSCPCERLEHAVGDLFSTEHSGAVSDLGWLCVCRRAVTPQVL